MKEFILIKRLKDNYRPIVTNDEDAEWNRAVYSCTKIVNQFVKELISRLKNERDRTFFIETSRPQEQYVYSNSYRPLFDTAIGIINELVEEFATDINVGNKDGWISCSERLPDKKGFYVVTQERYSLDGKHKLLRTEVCADVLFDPTNQKWCRSNNLKVIAWQPLPKPYKKEGVVCR